MLRVYACVTEQHDLWLVVLAGFICLLACFTALSLRARSAAAPAIKASLLWLTAAAAVFGGGVWTTHFIAMLAFRPNLPIGYDLGLTITSVAVAVSMTWVGLQVAGRRSNLAAMGGAIVGASISGMHYIGMAAMRVPAEVQWDAGYVVASLAIGVALGAAALHTAARSSAIGRRAVAATLLCLGIVGMHFTAMAAAVLVPDPRIPLPDQIIAPEWLAVGVASVTILILAMGLVGAILDQYLAGRTAMEAERLRLHVAELEEMHRQATEQLVRAERLSTLGQLAGTVSHELRNPLGSISNSAALLRQLTVGKVPGVERPFDRLDRNVERCNRIIGDLLEHAREKEIQREPTALDVWLGEILDEITLPDGIVLVRDLRSRCDVAIDGSRLRQVVVNLIDNAAQALLDKAWRRPDGHRPVITVRTEAAGRQLTLSVSDNGPGIAEQNLAKIFKPLFTTKSFGVGLGLATVLELVERHGGRIEVKSEPDHGARFTISLPRLEFESSEESRPAKSEPTAAVAA